MMRSLATLCLMGLLSLSGCTFSVSTQGTTRTTDVSEDAPSSAKHQESHQKLQPEDPASAPGTAAQDLTPTPEAPAPYEPPEEPEEQTLEALATRLEGFLGYDELLFYDIDGEVCYCIENRRGTAAQCQARRDSRAEFAHRMSDCVGEAVRQIQTPPPPAIFTYMSCLEDIMVRSESCLQEVRDEHGADCFEDRRHAVAPCRRLFMSSVPDCEGPLRQDAAGSAFLNEIESQIISNQCHTAP